MVIRVERSEHTSWIIVDRQDAGNSLGYRDLQEITQAINAECSSGSTATVAITGAGEKFFITGIDLRETAEAQSEEDAWRLMYEGLGGFCRAAFNCRKPVIAAVNGYALGAGFEVLYAADLAYAAKWAKFGLPPVRYGMVPPASSTIGMLLGMPKVISYLALTGDFITAEEAARYGIINGVVDSVEQLRSKVEEVSAKIAEAEPEAVAAARALMAEAKMQALSDKGLRTLAAFTARPVVRERVLQFLNRKRA
ncbi:enoyl-CoA hydratase/isomerase family protein [Acidilobus sp.]|jgi:enoyl-CoA hydratase/carnithine racemase|uniref:enoyl-CoA hydratase/isomerase family protein n=1 Tax=Acidilobus sp. TaxID=1872109 RepID=UPI003CFF643C